MELYEFFKSVIDMDTSAVVICDLSHKIVYMNPAAAERYSKRGGTKLVGSSCLTVTARQETRKLSRWRSGSGKVPRITSSTHFTMKRKTRTST